MQQRELAEGDALGRLHHRAHAGNGDVRLARVHDVEGVALVALLDDLGAHVKRHGRHRAQQHIAI